MMPLAWLLGAALSASAHELFPIRPVHVTLRVEPDRIVADLRADSIYLIEEVVHLHPMPSHDWPEATRAIAENYVNAHFTLTAGGPPLRGKLVAARYRQYPWEVNEEGLFILRLVYPSASAGSTLNGTARFFDEYRKELEAEFAGRPVPFADGHRTFVDIPGRRRLAFELTPSAPSFTASAGDARRTAFAMALEAAARGLTAAVSAAGFPVFLAAALCLGAKPPSRAHTAVLLAASAAGFLAGGSAPPAPWLVWAAVLAAALSAWRGRVEMAAPALAALAFVWRDAVAVWLPHSPLALPSALAGALAAGAAQLCVVWLGVRAEHRRLAAVSESRVEELFARRTRLTATALAMAGAYGLWQTFQR